jgi:hypothetical protein
MAMPILNTVAYGHIVFFPPGKISIIFKNIGGIDESLSSGHVCGKNSISCQKMLCYQLLLLNTLTTELEINKELAIISKATGHTGDNYFLDVRSPFDNL